MKVKRATGTAVPMAIGMISGVGLGLITTILLSGLVAYLVLTEKLQETSVGYCAAIILASSVGLGCLIATVLIKRMLMQVCIGVGGSYYGTVFWRELPWHGRYCIGGVWHCSGSWVAEIAQ